MIVDTSICIGVGVWILLVIVALTVLTTTRTCETFADPSTIPASLPPSSASPPPPPPPDQCLECATYFAGAVSLVFAADADDSTKARRISEYASHQSSVIVSVLAAIKGFVSGEPIAAGSKCKTKPTEPSQAYYDCMREHVTATVSCDAAKMTQIQNSCSPTNRNCTAYSDAVADCELVARVIDDVIAKASICTDSVAECSDVSKYPKAQEQEVCKETHICKTVADLETNITKVCGTMTESLAACTLKLTDGNSECVKHFLAIVSAKSKTNSASASATSGIGGLGSDVGTNDVAFDISTMVIGNTAA